MSYLGKDVVNRGSGLWLDADRAWPAIAHCSRKNVAKARQAGVEGQRVAPTAENLEAVRRIWYHPEDPNFPSELPEHGALYHATLSGELCGGMILLPVGTHLFLNNLTADDRGKSAQAQSLLLWRAVEDYTGSEWRYLDIGVSYRPNLLAFFQRWSTLQYPVIFHPPTVRNALGFHPLRTAAAEVPENTKIDLSAWTLGRPATLLPSVEIALDLLQRSGLEYRHRVFPDAESHTPQLVDLTTTLALPWGALVTGVEWPASRLWNEFGCFDAVKTERLSRSLSAPEHQPDAIRAQRQVCRAKLSELFEHEDLCLELSLAEVETFALRFASSAEAQRIADRYQRFCVDCRVVDRTVHLPCHQTMTDAEIELLYAIYRGHLNLCSEWIPTSVRGQLKTA